jgi:hypothetical protein
MITIGTNNTPFLLKTQGCQKLLKSKRKNQSVLLLLLCMLIFNRIQGQQYPFTLPATVTASLNVSTVTKVKANNLLLGTNHAGFKGLDEMELVRYLNPVTIRFPSGVWSNWYDWELDSPRYYDNYPINPDYKAAIDTWTNNDTKWGFPELTTLHNEMGFDMLWTYNLNFDSNTKSVNRLKDSELKGYNVTAIELANEQFWLDQRSNRIATPTLYYSEATSLSAALKAEKPTVKLSVPLSWRTSTHHPAYNAALTQTTNYFDAISLHKYLDWDKNEPVVSQAAYQGILTARVELKNSENVVLGYAPGKPIWLSEWGVSCGSQAAAFLGQADTYLYLFENQNVYERANWYGAAANLNPMYILADKNNIVINDIQKTGYGATYEILRSVLENSDLLNGTMTTTALVPGSDAVVARAVEKNGKKQLLVVNKTPQNVTFTLKYDGVASSKTMVHKALSFASLSSNPTFAYNEDPLTYIGEGTNSFVLPPYSINAMTEVILGETTNTISTAGTSTWKCPANVYSVKVECWGAGGAGGTATGGTGKTGGGGGGGSYVTNTINVVPGTDYAITVGTGGTVGGGTAPISFGGSGGKSEFSGGTISTITASGGTGGSGCAPFTTNGFGGILGGVYGYTVSGVGTGYINQATVSVTGNGSGASGKISGTGNISYVICNSMGSGYTAITNVNLPTGTGQTATALFNPNINAGDTIILGTNGNNGVANTSGGSGGNGGNGGAGATTNNGTTGQPGTAPGGGGSGARNNGSTAFGGAGADGQVVLTYTVAATWNGATWSNTTGPDSTIEAVITGNYVTTSKGGFTAKKLTINPGGALTINSGTNVTVKNEVINNAASNGLVIENNANLIQQNNSTNTGLITVKRNSSALFRLDYTLWSSPVTGTQTLAAFSPMTSQSPNRFYTYNSATNLYTNILPSLPFVSGKGYLIRMPNTDSTINYDAGTATLSFPGIFTGIPTNGDVAATLNYTDSTHKYNLVGNPYPSTLSADAFITANTENIESTLYFWRKTNGASGSAYATYNLTGTTVTAAATPSSSVPNGIIQVGQGFIVGAKTATTVPAFFTNTMRVGNNGNQFFRTKAVEKNRLWLNLTNPSGAFSQMLVGYLTNATQGFDEGIDGKYINDSPIALTSNINNEEYTIQGRSLPFNPSDVVALNFKTDVAGDYTIALDHFDGLFAAGQDVYLLDGKTGTETDLKATTYTFTATAGTENTRFSLKYQKTLKVEAPAFNENSVTVYRNKGTLYANSGELVMTNIKVFDIQGRLIVEQKNIRTTTATMNNLKASKQVLIVKISGEDNQVVTKKVAN